MSGAATVEAWSGKDRGDENFPVGSLLIRRDLRAHVHAFYAFARNADDIADSGELAAEEKIARLDVMEDVLLGRRDDGAPSALRLRGSLAETGVTARHSLDLLIAFRRDATKLRYADWAELHEYCRYSAMPVGRHVLDLHGEDRVTYVPVGCAVHVAAGAEPSAGLREGPGGAGPLLSAGGGGGGVCEGRRRRRNCERCSMRCWIGSMR